MTDKERRLIAEHECELAIRWARNMLSQALSSHSDYVESRTQDQIRRAVNELTA